MPRRAGGRSGIVGLGIRAPSLGRHAGLDALPRPPSVAGIDPGRARRPDRGASVPAVTRARAWVRSGRGPTVTRRRRGRPCRSAKLGIWRRKPPRLCRGRLPPLLGGAPAALAYAHANAVPQYGRQSRPSPMSRSHPSAGRRRRRQNPSGRPQRFLGDPDPDRTFGEDSSGLRQAAKSAFCHNIGCLTDSRPC